MGVYSGFGQDTSTADTTIVQLKQPASALKRLKIRYVEAGSDASADSAYEAVLQRTSTAGSGGSALTAYPRDPADGAASGVFRYADSVEPTYPDTYPAGVHLPVFGHQRSTFQWYAMRGAEIIIPVTNDAGVGFRSKTSATAFNLGVCLEWEE